MNIKIDYFDYKEARYQRLRNVTFWALVTIVLVFSIVFINSCTNPIPANAEEVDMNIIAEIESKGDPYAYNTISQARGVYQITPICLYEYNDKHRSRIITEEQLFDPVYNGVVAFWYMQKRIPEMLRYYFLQDTIENRLIAYNFGIGNLVKWYKNGAKFNKLPKETQNYIKKYHKLEKEKK